LSYPYRGVLSLTKKQHKEMAERIAAMLDDASPLPSEHIHQNLLKLGRPVLKEIAGVIKGHQEREKRRKTRYRQRPSPKKAAAKPVARRKKASRKPSRRKK
jgi:hypothetical protein